MEKYGCDGKVKFLNQQRARHANKWVIMHGNCTHVYQCSSCHFWHVGNADMSYTQPYQRAAHLDWENMETT